jgi:hypothetical protein
LKVETTVGRQDDAFEKWETMTDGEEIRQLESFYALAIDTKQWHILDRVFTPNVEIEYPVRRWNGLDEFRDDFQSSHQRYDVTQHLIINVNSCLNGDTGNAFSQCLFHLIKRGLPGGDMISGGAWYDDSLVMGPAGWRIAKRTCRVAWLQGNVAVMGRSSSVLTSMSEGVEDGTLTFVDALRSATSR